MGSNSFVSQRLDKIDHAQQEENNIYYSRKWRRPFWPDMAKQYNGI
jgi:hypothetical protein